MTKNKTFKFSIILVALFTALNFLSACDDTSEVPTISSVVFDFDNPIALKMYGKGDTVRITGTISWESTLHGYELEIKNTSMDSVMYTKHSHADGGVITIDEYWINSVNHHSNMTLTIDALTSHDGAKESTTIDFHCHPM